MGRLAEFFARRVKFEPEGHVVSGRLAEFRLMKLTRAVAGEALVLEGIRIPGERRHKNRLNTGLRKINKEMLQKVRNLL